jgi:hypothetical protein
MPSKIAKQIEWAKLAKYCELTGETRDSVMKKRSSGMFIESLEKSRLFCFVVCV